MSRYRHSLITSFSRPHLVTIAEGYILETRPGTRIGIFDRSSAIRSPGMQSSCSHQALQYNNYNGRPTTISDGLRGQQSGSTRCAQQVTAHAAPVTRPLCLDPVTWPAPTTVGTCRCSNPHREGPWRTIPDPGRPCLSRAAAPAWST